jgi:hypothetical protein
MVSRCGLMCATTSARSSPGSQSEAAPNSFGWRPENWCTPKDFTLTKGVAGLDGNAKQRSPERGRGLTGYKLPEAGRLEGVLLLGANALVRNNLGNVEVAPDERRVAAAAQVQPWTWLSLPRGIIVRGLTLPPPGSVIGSAGIPVGRGRFDLNGAD